MIELILEVHTSKPAERFKVSLKAEDTRSQVQTDSEDPGFIFQVMNAMNYLAGQDGKLRDPYTANLADWCIVIGKLVKGDVRILSGKLPESEFNDPMTEAVQGE